MIYVVSDPSYYMYKLKIPFHDLVDICNTIMRISNHQIPDRDITCRRKLNNYYESLYDNESSVGFYNWINMLDIKYGYEASNMLYCLQLQHVDVFLLMAENEIEAFEAWIEDEPMWKVLLSKVSILGGK